MTKSEKRAGELRERLNSLSDYDVGWLAGLVEGEGTFFVTSRQIAGFEVSMTDHDTMLRLSRLMGMRLYGPYESRGKHHCLWYRIGTQAAPMVRVVAEFLEPHLSFRRQGQIEGVLRCT